MDGGLGNCEPGSALYAVAYMDIELFGTCTIYTFLFSIFSFLCAIWIVICCTHSCLRLRRARALSNMIGIECVVDLGSAKSTKGVKEKRKERKQRRRKKKEKSGTSMKEKKGGSKISDDGTSSKSRYAQLLLIDNAAGREHLRLNRDRRRRHSSPLQQKPTFVTPRSGEGSILMNAPSPALVNDASSVHVYGGHHRYRSSLDNLDIRLRAGSRGTHSFYEGDEGREYERSSSVDAERAMRAGRRTEKRRRRSVPQRTDVMGVSTTYASSPMRLFEDDATTTTMVDPIAGVLGPGRLVRQHRHRYFGGERYVSASAEVPTDKSTNCSWRARNAIALGLVEEEEEEEGNEDDDDNE